MVRSVVVAELLRARTKEFLLSAVAVELVPEARVLEARAPAERLAVPRRDARGDFQAAPEDQAAGDRAERDREGQDREGQGEVRDPVMLLERSEVAVGKLRDKWEAGTAVDLTPQADGETRRRACVEQADPHGAVWVRWQLKPA
jgi:hypothetical protein